MTDRVKDSKAKRHLLDVSYAASEGVADIRLVGDLVGSEVVHFRRACTAPAQEGLSDRVVDLAEIENKVNQQLANWLATEAQITMRCEGEHLTDSRYWQCDLQEGNLAVIPCGGTHSASLTEFSSLQVRLTQRDEQHIEMHTRVNHTSEQ